MACVSAVCDTARLASAVCPLAIAFPVGQLVKRRRRRLPARWHAVAAETRALDESPVEPSPNATAEAETRSGRNLEADGRVWLARRANARRSPLAQAAAPVITLSPTLGQARLRQRAGAAICVQDVDVQCVLQFTLIHAAGCALHRRTSRVIHRIELCFRACAVSRALALDLDRSSTASATLATRLRSRSGRCPYL